MIDIAREAVRSLDMAIDFGTASVRVLRRFAACSRAHIPIAAGR
jgi:hypothetical protein